MAQPRPRSRRRGLRTDSPKLLRFFEWRRQSEAEELVDRTIDRVTRKLLQGGVRPESDPLGFFYGVARNILREHSADQVQHRSALLGHLPANSGSQVEPEEDVEKRLAFLERCLSRLPLPDRELIVD